MTIEEVPLDPRKTKNTGLSEQLRIQGEFLILRGAPGAAVTGEDHLRRALDVARRQPDCRELRAARSLPAMARSHRMAKACKLLAQVYGRSTEGFATGALQAAKTLLEHLA